MAVEAPNLTLYPPQLLLSNPRITIHDIHNGIDRLGYRTPPPLSAAETLLPMYSSAFTNPDPLKAESDLTSRKRSRDSSPAYLFSNNAKTINRNNAFTFLGEDISLQMQRQQFEIDQYVARHAENVRVDVEQRRRRLISALDESITRILRAKEEEITKMAKLNWALEERVRSLCTENQIWRELAETNESTANALRNNLKQVLEQLVNGDYRHRRTAAGEDDAQSCCESSNDNERTLAEQDSSNSNYNRMCKSCWKGESCVLLLPCRHLCLCTVCGSSVHICPICKSSSNISVHVHMS
ncbi:hypothetical protein SSX86_005987 [Deinandra increscens subsp. villosa]|uniref:RING-type domain-containing protein n=1 Tax=Deinandra increscens subsp. villosa TaxID=3103831 RepID=A0AAP0DM69_9ASTR